MCKKIFTNFFINLGVLGNLCEADVSNQDPRWNQSRDDGSCRATTHAGRTTTGPGRAWTGPKSQKTLESHISLKTCPNRAFEVFLASTRNVDAKKHLKRSIRTSFE